MGKIKESLLDEAGFVAAEAAFFCPICDRYSLSHLKVPELHPGTLVPAPRYTRVRCTHCGEFLHVYVQAIDDHYEAEFFEYDGEIDVRPVYPALIDEIEDWSTYEVPDDTKSVFLSHYNQTDALLGRFADQNDILNRMIFVQNFSAFEVYLCNTLIKNVLGRVEFLNRFVAGANDLRNIKVPLNEIAMFGSSTCLDYIKSKVVFYLKSVVYHDFEKVRPFYIEAFGFDIFIDARIKTLLFNARNMRHDCVHRNGYDKEGKQNRLFTEYYVRQVAEAMLITVNHISDHLAEVNLLGARTSLLSDDVD